MRDGLSLWMPITCFVMFIIVVLVSHIHSVSKRLDIKGRCTIDAGPRSRGNTGVSSIGRFGSEGRYSGRSCNILGESCNDRFDDQEYCHHRARYHLRLHHGAYALVYPTPY